MSPTFAVDKEKFAELEDVVAAIRQPLVLLDPQHRVKWAGKAFYSAFQVSKEETENRSLYELGNGQWDIPELRQLLGDIVATNGEVSDFRVEHAFDGLRRRVMLLNARCVRREPPRTDGILLAIEDITDRESAVETLREREEQLRHIVDGVADYAIIIVDLAGRVTSWNKGAERLKGYSEDEIIGQNFACFYRDADARAGQPAEALRRAAAEGSYETEGWRVRKDGSRFLAHILITSIKKPCGEIQAFTKITRDITQTRRILDELERSNKELEQFAYVASHDLQEPLRMVAGWVGWLDARLKRNELDAETKKAIRYAVEGAKRMQALVRDLLSYSRIAKEQSELLEIDSGATLTRALANLDLALRDTDANVIRGDLPLVTADLGQLTQVFQNLISNALKFRHSTRAPCVRIGAHSEGDNWVFSVADNGIGIEPQYAERIFRIFQRLHGPDEHPGTGIGLAICKRIIERHGGRIWLDAEASDNGATFLFTLPRSRPT